MKTILQIISDSNIGGAGRSLINYLRYEDRSCFRSHVVLPRNSALKPEIEGMGIPIYEIDAIADKSMDVSAIAPLRQIIKEVKPDLIHTHGSMSGRIAAKLCGRKVIYTKHCAFPLGKLMRSIPGQCASKAMDLCLSDGAIAIGDSVREILLQSGVPDRKIHVLYNGVTPLVKPGKEQREQVRQGYGFQEEDFVLGILARIETYKGHGVLMEAVEQLIAQGRNVKLLVAGEGTYEEELRRRAQALPAGSVHFAGFVSDVEKALWAMDLQINASTESETSSLSLLEGMSLGLPAVVSDVGGNPVLIQDGENGRVVPRRNSGALAECVAELMDDPEQLRKLSAGAEKIFQERFTGACFAEHVQNVYRTVLK